MEVVQTFTPKRGDVVVLRAPEMDRDAMERALESVTDWFPNGVLVVALPDGWELEHLSEEEMERFGWVRSAGPVQESTATKSPLAGP